jgi:hypothetical protein
LTKLNVQAAKFANASKADLEAKRTALATKTAALQAAEPGASSAALLGGVVLGAAQSAPVPRRLPGAVVPRGGPLGDHEEGSTAGSSDPSTQYAEALVAGPQSKEYGQLASRLLTRLLTEASIVVEGEAVVEWELEKARGKHKPEAGLAEGGAGARLHKLSFRTEGQVEFTATGALAWFPALMINGLGSKVADQVGCPGSAQKRAPVQ